MESSGIFIDSLWVGLSDLQLFFFHNSKGLRSIISDVEHLVQ